MTDTRAQIHGVKSVVGSGALVIPGRCIVWSISIHDSANGDEVWDSATDAPGTLIAEFQAGGSEGFGLHHFHYYQGMPVEIGVSCTELMTFTYTPLP